MFRKRKQPTPLFRLPPPYNPITTERGDLVTSGAAPYCAMMQVAEEDTHDNYVLCRGFDIRTNKFVDYENGNANKPGIPVAKPYGNRATSLYFIGQIIPAILPLQSSGPSPDDVLWRLGQNPGVSAVSSGHPADLDEQVNSLSTDEGKRINWMLLDSSSSTRKSLVRFTLAATLATSDASKTATITNQYGPGSDGPTGAGAITVHNLLTSTGGVYVFEGDSGDAGLAMWDTGTNYRIIQLECP
jgi:hypothetical protein